MIKYDKVLNLLREDDSSESADATLPVCLLNITIPSDDNSDSLTCYIEVAELSDFSDAILLNTSDNYSVMEAIIDGEVVDLSLGLIPAYLFAGTLVVNLALIDGIDCDKIYYARARFYDGNSYGLWKSSKFYGCGYLI